MRFVYLSYFINEQTPLYGGEKTIYIEERSQIRNGASSNTKYLKLPNHTGTHIDFPNHFSDQGKTINDYGPSFWMFDNVYVISYPVKAEEIIKQDLIHKYDIPSTTEFLIINTGFGKNRENEIYWASNPGLSPKLARSLKSRCPYLKVIGFDFISVSSYKNRMLGREAHKEFLVENDILLIEDMKLDGIKTNTIQSIIALPILIDNIDGVPITIIARL
jgi:arylformamidase